MFVAFAIYAGMLKGDLQIPRNAAHPTNSGHGPEKPCHLSPVLQVVVELHTPEPDAFHTLDSG